MATNEKTKKKLMNKLTELFQLDQPDLDFGFYRIMQAKADQITTFIDKDLLQIIEDAFGQIDESRKADAYSEVHSAIEQAVKYGAPDPEATDAVKEARKKYDEIIRSSGAEAEVYDHLYRFFERYYDDGDFISRRYYTKENASKAAPFSIPYNGEEVKLHWANADQYYVKTAEYFSNYSFDITQAAEVRALDAMSRDGFGIPDSSLKVHFCIIDASEGEHGNVKESDDKKRFFILHGDNPIEFNEAEELVINFEYKSLPGGKNDVDEETEKKLKEKYGKSLNKGDMPNLEITEKVIEAVKKNEKAQKYYGVLKLCSPTEKISNRPLLMKYINQYTARNTSDYFIHKDLGGFLKRELDFYIKNEVMHLDDIENADFPAVESYLGKIKVIRRIASKLIDFLAQLEDFQKKLWLKKKFVTETNYCITLDRVPEELYTEIAVNDIQREEWVRLFSVNELESYSVPLTTSFLKTNDKLVLDTAFFNDKFKAQLLEAINDFDEQCDGLLIHSENYQALNLLQERYREQVKYVYIDPPYNTAASEILYKNEYKHSSWLTLMTDRISASLSLINNEGLLSIAIDDCEGSRLQSVLDNVLGFQNRLGSIVVVHNPGGRHDDKFIATAHEYCFYYGKNIEFTKTNYLPLEDKDIESFKYQDAEGFYRTREFRRSGNNSTREARPKMFYPLLVKDGSLSIITQEEYASLYEYKTKTFNDELLSKIRKKYERKGFSFVLPIDPNGIMRVWRWAPDSFSLRMKEVFFEEKKDGYIIKVRDRLDNKKGLKPKSVWYKPKYTAALGTNLLKDYIGKPGLFSYPKSLSTVVDSIRIGSCQNDLIIDYFAGSGTTGHAVINLNREDKGKRKYILVEMGDYFNTVLKPRIQKVVYSTDWKNGKPSTHDAGISHCFKYIRLESYEDTLNNLVFDKDPVRKKVVESNPSLKEDYMLRYLLEVETRGSQSLLNIDAFSDPASYTMKIKNPGSDEQVTKRIDLIETFNYLIGLRLDTMDAPQTFTARFIRKPDPELPEDQHTKLVVEGKIKPNKSGKWWFRKIDGWVPSDSMNPNNGKRERVLIVWRKLTGSLEEDNLMLDEWFIELKASNNDFKYRIIYVNGSNNLMNLRKEEEKWDVRLIEEEFHKKMWEVQG